MQFLAARSRWTNFLLARYSIPRATWSPKPIRSFTVGFCRTHSSSLPLSSLILNQFSTGRKASTCFVVAWRSSYVHFVTDEVPQVAMLHIWQNHQRWTLWWKADSQQREDVGMTEVFHDDPFLQELGHLFQVCDALFNNNKRKKSPIYLGFWTLDFSNVFAFF